MISCSHWGMFEDLFARFYENLLGKPHGSFVGVYMGTPIFKIPEATYQRLNFGQELP